MFAVIGSLVMISNHYTLNGIKSRTVGDGQYGTARFATEKEIRETYAHVPYEPEQWRAGKHLPKEQGQSPLSGIPSVFAPHRSGGF